MGRVTRSWFDAVFGVGRRSWTVTFADQATADAVIGRVAEWPKVGTDRATGVVVRHKGELLSSSLWGSMACHTFDAFRVNRGEAGAKVSVEQTVATPFRLLGLVLVVGSYVGAVVGCVAAASGTPAALLALVGPVFFRLVYLEIGRQSAANDCRDFLLSGVHRQAMSAGAT